MRSSVRRAIELVAAEAHLESRNSRSKVPVVVVCGTAFIMAEARAELGVQEPRDSESLSDPLSSDENSNVDSQVCVRYMLALFALFVLFLSWSNNMISACL